MLTERQGDNLLRLARKEIERRLGKRAAEASEVEGPDDPALHDKRGVFVTLHWKGALRGCIGNLSPAESILSGVRRHAVNAAFNDHRFEPVEAKELPELRVEVSILTEPKPLVCKVPRELPKLLVPGVDGVILREQDGAGGDLSASGVETAA